jgi:hypothetical protein
MNASDSAAGLGGVVGLIICIFGIILGVVWIVFPFSVSSRLDKMLSESRKQTALLARIADNIPPRIDVPAKSSSTKYNPLQEEKTGSGVVFALILGATAMIVLVVWVAHRA